MNESELGEKERHHEVACVLSDNPYYVCKYKHACVHTIMYFIEMIVEYPQAE